MPTRRHKRRFRKHKHKRTLKHRGGATMCETFLMNPYLTEASAGREYNKLPPDHGVGQLHYNGERLPFDKLAIISKFGIMDWYRRQIPGRTEAEWDAITNITEVRILGAFFHRFKIVMERLNVLMLHLDKPSTEFFIDGSTMRSLARAFQKCKETILKDSNEYEEYKTKLQTFLFTVDDKHKALIKSELSNKIHIIESTLNKVQCVLYETMKIGKLPNDFVMDPRIDSYSKMEIIILLDNANYEKRMPDLPFERYEFTIKWMKFVDEFNNSINDKSPVTFNLVL
jgi:hypothetical protein